MGGNSTLPAGRTLTVTSGDRATLTVNTDRTLTNNGEIINSGTVNNLGTIDNRGGGTIGGANPVSGNILEVVPPTGIPGIAGYLWAMILFLAISAALWGYILRPYKANITF